MAVRGPGRPPAEGKPGGREAQPPAAARLGKLCQLLIWKMITV